MLSSLAEKGIRPLGSYLSEKLQWRFCQAELTADSNACSYVQETLKVTPHKAYTYSGERMKFLQKRLERLEGLAQINLINEIYEHDLSVEFRGDKITILTVWSTPEIRSHQFDRKEWTDALLATTETSDPQFYGKIALLTEEELKHPQFRKGISFSEIEVIPLK